MNNEEAEVLRAEVARTLPEGYVCGEILCLDLVRTNAAGEKIIVEDASFWIETADNEFCEGLILHLVSRKSWMQARRFMKAWEGAHQTSLEVWRD